MIEREVDFAEKRFIKTAEKSIAVRTRDSLALSSPGFARNYFANLDIQWSFLIAFWAEKETRSVYPALYFFPTKDGGAMQTNMNMEKRRR